MGAAVDLSVAATRYADSPQLRVGAVASAVEELWSAEGDSGDSVVQTVAMGPVPALSNVGQVSSGTSSVDLLLASTGGDLRSVRPRRDAAPILSVTAAR